MRRIDDVRVHIRDGQLQLAQNLERVARIVSRMSAQSKPYGTSIAYARGRGVVRI